MRPWPVVLTLGCMGLACAGQEFEITAIERGGTIRWHALDGHAYTVQSRNSPTASWQTVLPEDQWPTQATEWLVTGGAPWPSAGRRFYRVMASAGVSVPEDMVLIPGGDFLMGDSFGEGETWEVPRHPVTVSSFYIKATEMTKEQWDEVYTWAVAHDYAFDNAGAGKGPTHPVERVNWYDAAKWCNARSKMEGRTPCYYTDAAKTSEYTYQSDRVDVHNDWVRWDANGYRLPTEAEWECAARGGVADHRFPWSDTDTISHSRANYQAGLDTGYDESYDENIPSNYHPDYDTDPPFTSPAGSFAPNDYALYDMAGNVWEWCWDWYGLYAPGPATDPHGPDAGTYAYRMLRGGSFNYYSDSCRVARRSFTFASQSDIIMGFRPVIAAP